MEKYNSEREREREKERDRDSVCVLWWRSRGISCCIVLLATCEKGKKEDLRTLIFCCSYVEVVHLERGTGLLGLITI